jgi:hypothetical protein
LTGRLDALEAATDVVPKCVSPSDPAAQWTGAHKGPAFFACADNYLIDVKFGVIVDVEASRAIRQAEVGAAKTTIDRTEQGFGLKPERLAADTAYGVAPTLNWLVEDKGIAPHIPLFDKSCHLQSMHVVSHSHKEAGQFQHIRGLSGALGIHRLLKIISCSSKKLLVVRRG